MSAVLSLAHVHHIVGGARVLDGIDLVLQPGESLAIVGGSGSGKSTLARIAGGMTLPTGGDVSVLGVDTSALTPMSAVRPKIGMTLQGGSLFAELSVEDNLRLGAGAVSPGSWRALASRVDRLLYAFGLEDTGDRPADSLSVGARRQLEIVRALLRDPALLILDEPFEGAAADAEAMALAIRRAMRRHQGATLVLTQDPRLAERLADRQLVLRHGRLLQHASGTSRPETAPSAAAEATAATLA